MKPIIRKINADTFGFINHMDYKPENRFRLRFGSTRRVKRTFIHWPLI
jgi:hypothetical protein